MANESLRQIQPNGLPEGFIAMADAKVEKLQDTLAVSCRMVITDPAGDHHAMILQFFVHGDTPAGDPGRPGPVVSD